jgi:hypothetical protein
VQRGHAAQRRRRPGALVEAPIAPQPPDRPAGLAGPEKEKAPLVRGLRLNVCLSPLKLLDEQRRCRSVAAHGAWLSQTGWHSRPRCAPALIDHHLGLGEETDQSRRRQLSGPRRLTAPAAPPTALGRAQRLDGVPERRARVPAPRADHLPVRPRMPPRSRARPRAPRAPRALAHERAESGQGVIAGTHRRGTYARRACTEGSRATASAVVGCRFLRGGALSGITNGSRTHGVTRHGEGPARPLPARVVERLPCAVLRGRRRPCREATGRGDTLERGTRGDRLIARAERGKIARSYEPSRGEACHPRG